jgi:hypothetical protein
MPRGRPPSCNPGPFGSAVWRNYSPAGHVEDLSRIKMHHPVAPTRASGCDSEHPTVRRWATEAAASAGLERPPGLATLPGAGRFRDRCAAQLHHHGDRRGIAAHRALRAYLPEPHPPSPRRPAGRRRPQHPRPTAGRRQGRCCPAKPGPDGPRQPDRLAPVRLTATSRAAGRSTTAPTGVLSRRFPLRGQGVRGGQPARSRVKRRPSPRRRGCRSESHPKARVPATGWCFLMRLRTSTRPAGESSAPRPARRSPGC